jgi:phage-related protein
MWQSETELLRKLLLGMETIMGDLTKLTAAVTQLQTDTSALTGLITNTVIPDINKAIALITAGSDQAAIDALTGTVSSLDAAVTPVTSSLQATDMSLEGSGA